MTILATIKQVATNNSAAGVTSAGGTTIGVVAWLTDNLGVLSLSFTFGMFCIGIFQAYSSWHFKALDEARKVRREKLEFGPEPQPETHGQATRVEGIDHVE